MEQSKDLKTRIAFQTTLRQSVFLPVFLGLLIAAIFLVETQSLRHSMQWLDHTDQAISKANHIQKLFIDAETGLRGFNVNREDSFLEPYKASVKIIPSEIKGLEDFVSDNPPQLGLLREIDANGDIWLESARDAIEKIKKGAGVYEGGLNHHGKAMMDEIRKQFGQFIDAEEKLRSERYLKSQRASKLATFTGITLGLILCFLILFWTRKLLFRLSNQYETVLDEAIRSREWFQTTLTSIGDAVIVVNNQSKIDFINPIAEGLTGWAHNEALGLPMESVFRIVNEKTREPAFNPVNRVLKEGITVGLANHTVLIGKNGKEYPIEDSAAPVRKPDGTVFGVVLVFRDVTSRYQADAILQESESRYRNQATNLEKAVRSRDEFLSIASHELKTPLTTLKLQLQMSVRNIKPLEGLMPPPEKVKKIVETCFEQTLRLDTLIDGLLDVTRIQQGKLQFHFEKADLSEVIKKTIGQLDAQLEAAHCSIDLESKEPVIATFDKFRIEQVVTNLLSNAMKYGPGKPIKITVGKGGKNGQITITDQGIGIPKEKHSMIFERFERAIDATNVSGLGLGLYIVSQIISGHDGKIEVRSEMNKGATFTVTIPLESVQKDFTRTEKELGEKS